MLSLQPLPQFLDRIRSSRASFMSTQLQLLSLTYRLNMLLLVTVIKAFLMPWSQSFQMHVIQCAVSILQRTSTRNLAETISLFSGKQLEHSLKVLLIELFKLSKVTLLKLKSIYDQLAMRTLLLLAFHCLDLAMTLLILWSQLTQPGVRYESFLHFNSLMGYINGL